MFSELVVAYLFLGGTGAGALLIAAVLMLLADERAVSRGVVVRFRDNGSAAYRRLFVPILVASLVVLVLGALCLAADVGRLDRILLLAVSSPSNYLVVGFWALLLCGTLAAAMLLVWLGVPSVSLPLFRALAVLLAAVSFVAVIYTGLLLSGMPSVPLWFGPWLPGLFAISALSCGVALVSMVAVFSGMATVFGRTMRQVVRADMVLLALEAVVVALWLGAAWLEHGGSASSGATPTDAAALASVASVLNGACSLPFWGGLVLVGLVAPFAIEAVLARCNASKGRRRGVSRLARVARQRRLRSCWRRLFARGRSGGRDAARCFRPLLVLERKVAHVSLRS